MMLVSVRQNRHMMSTHFNVYRSYLLRFTLYVTVW